MKPKIIAAGAVVWRKSKKNVTEIAIVHRPKYDDLSLPKGKVEPNETLIGCAYREVLEETNLSTQFGPFLGDVEYFTPEGLKKVSYWSAKAIDGEANFIPNQEVDKLIWLPISQAIEILTMETDKEIVARFANACYDSQPLILLRHAKALARSEWSSDDDRPLDVIGQTQSKKLLSSYQAYNLAEIHTSDAIRCYDTAAPMAKSLGTNIS